MATSVRYFLQPKDSADGTLSGWCKIQPSGIELGIVRSATAGKISGFTFIVLTHSTTWSGGTGCLWRHTLLDHGFWHKSNLPRRECVHVKDTKTNFFHHKQESRIIITCVLTCSICSNKNMQIACTFQPQMNTKVVLLLYMYRLITVSHFPCIHAFIFWQFYTVKLFYTQNYVTCTPEIWWMETGLKLVTMNELLLSHTLCLERMGGTRTHSNHMIQSLLGQCADHRAYFEVLCRVFMCMHTCHCSYDYTHM